MRTPIRTLCAVGVLSLVAGIADATNILAMRQDTATDEVVIDVAYRGTNPNHQFSLLWSDCRDFPFEGASYQVEARLADTQAEDRALEEFKQTLRFTLSSLKCRPAKLTVSTAAGFHQTIVVQ
jgi:hypothetical protein